MGNWPGKGSGGHRATGVVPSAGLFLFAILLPTPAWAYLDPGTGSIILQVLLGGVGGGLVLLRLYWGRVKELFSRKPPGAPPFADGDRPE